MLRTVFDDDQRAFGETVRQFVERSLRPRLAEFEADRCISREAWAAAGQAGILGLALPEEYGGAGPADYRYLAIAGEELARVGVAYASSFGIQYGIVAPYLVDLTTAEQKARWLPGVADGSLVTAVAMTEPSTGSDLAAIRTVARRVSGGWVVDGAKTFITNGSQADLVVVALKTAPDLGSRGMSVVVVEEGMSGFTRGSKFDKVGQHAADTAELYFDGVFVPDENVLGETGQGFTYLTQRLAQERLEGAVAYTAHAHHVLEQTLTYVRSRRAFGQSIGSFQANSFTLAELVTKLDVTRAFVDHCITVHAAGRLTPVEAAKAKWWSSDVQNSVIDACVQLHGGYGYMREFPVAQAWLDARVTRIWAGTNEIMKEIIGRSLDLR